MNYDKNQPTLYHRTQRSVTTSAIPDSLSLLLVNPSASKEILMDLFANATYFPSVEDTSVDLFFIEDASLEYVGGGTITNTI